MTRLYDIRSSFVHSGYSDQLADRDLKAIRTIVDLAINKMLCDKRFIQIRDAASFERWFEQRLLESTDDKAETESGT